MEHFEITIGDQQVISHGTVLSSRNEPIIFFFGDNYKVEIVFAEDETNTQSRIIGSTFVSKHFRIVATNFGSALGNCTIEPIYVAKRKENKILLHLAVYTIGAAPPSIRLVHYTFFKGGEA